MNNMKDDIEDLVKRIRADTDPGGCDLYNAADALEALLIDRDALRVNLEKATKALENAISGIEAWCKAIQENGTGWDDWDEHYKDFAYRGGLDDMQSVLAELSADAQVPPRARKRRPTDNGGGDKDGE